MQEGYLCEVIGCEEQACWLLVGPQDNSSEEYLCSAHWETLNHRDPRRASLYTHLSSLPGEGMGLLDIAPTANPRQGSEFVSRADIWQERRSPANYKHDCELQDPSGGSYGNLVEHPYR